MIVFSHVCRIGRNRSFAMLPEARKRNGWRNKRFVFVFYFLNRSTPLTHTHTRNSCPTCPPAESTKNRDKNAAIAFLKIFAHMLRFGARPLPFAQQTTSVAGNKRTKRKAATSGKSGATKKKTATNGKNTRSKCAATSSSPSRKKKKKHEQDDEPFEIEFDLGSLDDTVLDGVADERAPLRRRRRRPRRAAASATVRLKRARKRRKTARGSGSSSSSSSASSDDNDTDDDDSDAFSLSSGSSDSDDSDDNASSKRLCFSSIHFSHFKISQLFVGQLVVSLWIAIAV